MAKTVTITVVNGFNGGKVERINATTVADVLQETGVDLHQAVVHLDEEELKQEAYGKRLRENDFLSIQKKKTKSGLHA